MRALTLAILLGTAVLAAVPPLSVPFFTQQKNGCGAASVAMVMHYWSPGHPSAGDVYQSLYDPALHGIPLVEMKHYLETHGFRAYSMHGHAEGIETQLRKGRPVIVALRTKESGPIHFAVVTGTADGAVLLNDPTRSRLTRMKQAEFEERWKLAENWMLLAVPSPANAAAPPEPE